MFLPQELENLSILESLIENSYNSIVITDANLELPGPKFLYVNQAFTNKTGYTIEDLKDKTPRILQGEETDRKILDELKEKCKRGEFFSGSTVNYKKDGTKYYVEWNISPIKDENGNITKYISIQKDISLDMEYKQSLEKKVQEQIEKLKKQNEILHFQAKQAALGEMIDAIAHQWKQPLNAINLQASILIDEVENCEQPTSDEILKSQEFILKQVKHMVSTLEEFRNFLRPNKITSSFRISKVTNSVLSLIKDEFTKYNIDINLDLQNDFEAKGVENEFKHIILNILNNAKDALNENNIVNKNINIQLIKIKDKNIITICDNGGGIPEHIIKDIFKANITTKEDGKGTGIGLYISKQIADKMGIEINALNKDKGACFELIFQEDDLA